MKLSALLAPMVARGVDAATILATVHAWEDQQQDALEQRRANDRARQERHRHVMSRDVTVTVSSREQVTRVEDNLLTSEKEPQKEEQKERNALTREFDDFWTAYPNKVGKPKAKAAFVAARKRADLADILNGLERYIASKPADRAWLNPATFLNQDRWADQPANVVPMARGSPHRGVDALINSLLSDMDTADANATTKTQGYPAAPRRISRQLSG